MNKAILFYRVNEPYGGFSNFARHGFRIGKVYWPTVEHYFQAQKFYDEILKEKIRNLPSPMDASKAGRDNSNPLRSDWNRVKDDIMRLAVLEKFKQNDDVRHILLSTGSSWLIEHTRNDNYWVDGGDGSGKNMLGIILMEIRGLLQ